MLNAAYLYTVVCSGLVLDRADQTGEQWYVDNSRVVTHDLTYREQQGNEMLASQGIMPVYIPYKLVWGEFVQSDGSMNIVRV